jgi:hypothetical protein
MSLGFIPAAVENVPPDEREFDANPSRFRSATPSLLFYCMRNEGAATALIFTAKMDPQGCRLA